MWEVIGGSTVFMFIVGSLIFIHEKLSEKTSHKDCEDRRHRMTDQIDGIKHDISDTKEIVSRLDERTIAIKNILDKMNGGGS